MTAINKNLASELKYIVFHPGYNKQSAPLSLFLADISFGGKIQKRYSRNIHSVYLKFKFKLSKSIVYLKLKFKLTLTFSQRT